MMIYLLFSIMFFFYSILMFIFSMIFLIFNLNIFFEWIFFYNLSMNFNFMIYIDFMTLMFLSIVFIISSMIMIYSSEYMYMDKNNIQFIYLMLLFILSMMFMIISPNLISIMLGWDMLGLISYCLIIYYQNLYSYNCGMLTFLSNRIGDIMIIISLSLMFNYSSWNFMNYKNLNNLMIIFIIISSITKSAQYPFSTWLPAAMAAPTPVSSLVHSSTLVTAGIFLMIRFNYLMSNLNLIYLNILSLMTMLFSSISANYEFDIKKIIALSTLSQLGLMFNIYSMNMYMLSFFHLLTHAMFKSMLFMCAGIIIHYLNNQDIRNLSNLLNYIPLTIMMFNLSSMALSGMFFLSGYFSKDFMIESMFMMKTNFMNFMLMMFSTSLTVCYSFRLLYYSLKMNFKIMYMYMYESKFMNYVMLILTILSIIGGSMLNMLMFKSIEFIYLTKFLKNLILMIMILGLLFGKILFYLKMNFNSMNFYFFNKMWLYQNILNLNTFIYLNYSKKFNLNNDKGWIEYIEIKMMFYFFNFKMMMKLNNNNFFKLFMFLMYLFMILLLFI